MTGPGETWPVHGLFAAVAADRPDAVALSHGGHELTYAELDLRANRLANHLREYGVEREEPVALQVGRSFDLVVGLLGILKAGACHVALDAGLPAERRRLILADAGVRVLLTHESVYQDPADGVTVVLLDRDEPEIAARAAVAPDVPVSGDNLAYLAYTSGSTGTPKAVGVPHRAVTRLVLDPVVGRLDRDDVVLQFASPAFDASTFELWAPLTAGARLALFPHQDPSLAEVAEVVREEGVTVLWLTAGLFHRLAGRYLGHLTGLRRLVAGGDVLSPAAVARVRTELPHVEMINGYGPTENTTFTTCHLVTGERGADTVPIGLPIRGTGVRILDEKLRPVPDGSPGELYAVGEGLARGYAGRAAATAERFVADPYAETAGSRMYRVGDLVRRGPDGALEFLGRTDRQVKIRGFRVEPGEAEAALAAMPGVREAAVVPQRAPDGDHRLAAFLVAEKGARPSVLLLRRRLGEILPGYSVPTSFSLLDALPLTPNGKVDRAALAERRSRARPDVHAEFRAPRTEREVALARLWNDLLGLDEVGVDDEFFELGGYSLLGMQITGEIAATYGVTITPRVFYKNATVAGLAGLVDARLADRGNVPPAHDDQRPS